MTRPLFPGAGRPLLTLLVAGAVDDAVTVAGKFTDAEASRVLAEGKAAGLYPADAFKTFGNTYVRKVCCE